MLDVRRLRALHAVVTTGSVKRAAAQIGYTPSAVSQHVAALERETGTALLERAGRGVRPTDAGRLLSDHAAAILDQLAEAERALAAHNAAASGTARVAAFATAAAAVIPPALARVPELDVDVTVTDSAVALELLRAGEIDVAVVEAHDVPEPGGELELLFTDPFWAVLPRGHRLTARRTLRLDALADEAWIDIMSEVGCCRAETDAAFATAGITPRRTAHADDYWPAQGFVAAGLGVALVPKLALRVLHEGVVGRRLTGPAQPTRHVLAATRSAVAQSPAVKALRDALRASVNAPA
jgi:DNA-binding transcriptional LysR family regulator